MTTCKWAASRIRVLRARVEELEEKLLVEEGRTLALRDAIEGALRSVEMRPIGRALLSAALDATQKGGEDE